MDDSLAGPELQEMRLRVGSAADEMVEYLADERSEVRYALGRTVGALAMAEGINAAHAFADDTITSLKVRSADAAGVWTSLYAAGDKSALPEAYRAIGLASEQTTALEDLGVVRLGGLHTVERLVELVEAGDTDSIALARELGKNVHMTDRAEQFNKLYRVGDAQSLYLALEAAKNAKIETKATGGRHYYRSERALTEMARFAAAEGKTDDALRLMGALENPNDVASLHAELYRHGRAESLHEVVQEYRNPDNPHAERLVYVLAKIGYRPAIEDIRKRVKGPKRSIWQLLRPAPTIADTADHVPTRIEDLITLHTIDSLAGERRAAAKHARQLVELIRSYKYGGSYLHCLGRVGLQKERLELATEFYVKSPSPDNAERILDVKHDMKLWNEVFAHHLHERRNPVWASGDIVKLAQKLKDVEKLA